jgi:lipoprotein-releasing system permease protein
MLYELLVGWRYTRATRRSHFVSFIALVSIAGVALGVAALVVVLSVVNGFEREFRKGILGAASHVQVSGPDGTLADWPAVARAAQAVPGVLAAAPFLNAQGLLSNDAEVQGVLLRGIDPVLEEKAAEIGQYLKGDARLGVLAAGQNGVILGVTLAEKLGVKVGDKVTLIAPRMGSNGGASAAQPLPRLAQLPVVALFGIGMHDFDSTLALMHLEDLRALFDAGDGLERVSGLRLRVEDPLNARIVAAQVGARLPQLAVTDWTRLNANLFHAVQTSKTMVVMVVSLLIAIAAFNIVASQVMAVTDKAGDIAILRTLGASPGGVQRIFMVQGALIGVVGTLIGLIVGVVIAQSVPAIARWVEKWLGFKPIAPEIYHIGELPSQLQWGDVMLTALVALVLCLLATIYPSRRAARLAPADALRYE